MVGDMLQWLKFGVFQEEINNNKKLFGSQGFFVGSIALKVSFPRLYLCKLKISILYINIFFKLTFCFLCMTYFSKYFL